MKKQVLFLVKSYLAGLFACRKVRFPKCRFANKHGFLAVQEICWIAQQRETGICSSQRKVLLFELNFGFSRSYFKKVDAHIYQALCPNTILYGKNLKKRLAFLSKTRYNFNKKVFSTKKFFSGQWGSR